MQYGMHAIEVNWKCRDPCMSNEQMIDAMNMLNWQSGVQLVSQLKLISTPINTDTNTILTVDMRDQQHRRKLQHRDLVDNHLLQE